MKTSYPPGSFNAHWFNLFNAISFQIMMGAPIILFAKSLGASSTVIGIIASFTPLMTVFQLPAARFLDRFGFREFVLMGWGLRTVLIFLVAAIPVLGFLDELTKMAVLLATLFLFNLLRGISSAAWMPWIAALIPEEVRGRFLSRDQMFMHLGCLLSLGASSMIMAGHVDPWEFSVVFLLSAIGGVLSLNFIRRIPEAASGEAAKRGSSPVPWRAMMAFPPFIRLLVFNVLYMIVVGSLGVFTVEFLREVKALEISTVLWLSAFSFLGALLALPWCGRIVDQVGSKPLIRVATACFGLVIVGWFLLAARVIPVSWMVFGGFNFLAGVASAMFNLANVRIVMGAMPEMGRNHFFALFTVISSLGLGVSPVAWGLLLDFLGTFEATTGVFTWNRHSIYFLSLLAINVLSFLATKFLIEPGDAKKFEAHPIYARLKRSQRIWQR
ncbi:MAG: hypothetical protein Fur0032_16690 [Terrimicrobiaceae bacterium]